MNRLLLAVWLSALSFHCLCGQKQRFRIMEYNAENLFDTLPDPGRPDTEFTPQGERAWTSPRYWAKLGRISRVVAAVGGMTPPDLVALVEVENDSVLSHLVRRTKLWRLKYDYVVTHSADRRGMNVALLYLPHRFRPVETHSLRVPPPSDKLPPTRDVLHVAGELVTGDTLDVLVCHLPSRRNGKPATAYRRLVAQRIRAFTDSLCAVRTRPYVVLTGDLNAWYPEKCLAEDLGARPASAPLHPGRLYLLSHRLQAADGIRGTYKYRGEWNQLDHYLVSGNLLLAPEREGTLHTRAEHCRIADFAFLLSPERNGQGLRPRRSYLGNYYQGGYSDHLPLVLDLFY